MFFTQRNSLRVAASSVVVPRQRRAGGHSEHGKGYVKPFYHDKGGPVLWDFTAQTNLVLRARLRSGNEATNLRVMFRDTSMRRLLFLFPFDQLNTTNFVTLIKPLTRPDWKDEEPFDLSQVISWDIYGDFSAEEQAMRFEVDSLAVEGPTVTGCLSMRYEIVNGTIILAWPTNLESGFRLQSSPALSGWWTNESAITLVGDEYRFAQPLTNGSQFFRLLATDEDPGEFLSMSEEEYLALVAPPPPETERAEVPQSNEAAYGEVDASPFSAPTPARTTNSYIDVASYSGLSWSSGFSQIFGSILTDRDNSYSLSFSDESGGSDSFSILTYASHVGSPTPPYPWLRTTNAVYRNAFTTTWAPGDANWPGGWRTETSTWATNYHYVSRPTVPYAQFAGMTNTYCEGDTNSQGYPCTGWFKTPRNEVNRFERDAMEAYFNVP